MNRPGRSVGLTIAFCGCPVAKRLESHVSASSGPRYGNATGHETPLKAQTMVAGRQGDSARFRHRFAVLVSLALFVPLGSVAETSRVSLFADKVRMPAAAR